MEQTQEQTAKTYVIGGVTYRIEPGTFTQHEWLAQGALKGVDFGSGISDTDLQCLIQRSGPEILGIVLIEEGQTREQKVAAGREAAIQLGQRFGRIMTPAEVRPPAIDFFLIDGYQNLSYFIDFRALEAREKACPTPPLLNPASVSSPTETAPSDGALPETVDRLTSSWTSSEAVSGAPTSDPSWVPAASSCPG